MNDLQMTPDIEELKAQWLADPCWDIEDTEGYEAHYDELLDYRREVEARWTASLNAKVQRKADELGIPDNLKLARHVLHLEWRLEQLESKLQAMTA